MNAHPARNAIVAILGTPDRTVGSLDDPRERGVLGRGVRDRGLDELLDERDARRDRGREVDVAGDRKSVV